MQTRGFTMIELLVVVALIFILGALAIPQLIDAQYRAKRSELIGNVAGIQVAEQAYKAAYEEYLTAEIHPTSDPNKKARSWGVGNSDFQELGWAPDGLVRGSYYVSTVPVLGAGGGVPNGDITVTGLIDVDDDDNDASYTATKSIGPTMITGANVY